MTNVSLPAQASVGVPNAGASPTPTPRAITRQRLRRADTPHDTGGVARAAPGRSRLDGPGLCRASSEGPRQALAGIGVEASPGVKIDIRYQRGDTLYFAIPPMAAKPEDAETMINQMDLWQSGELFCWMMPQAMGLELLRMRQSFRKNSP